MLGASLRAQGHEVRLAEHGAEAAEMAFTDPPDAVVTDLWMPGISGLQLCRLLRADTRTNHVPILLLTASDDRRTRFWAKHSGATAYVTKGEVSRLTTLLEDVPALVPSSRSFAIREMQGNVLEHLSELLDSALYDSTIAARVRGLSQSAESMEAFFSDLVDLVADVVEYRWFAIAVGSSTATHSPRVMVHAHPEQAPTVEHEVEPAFGLGTFAERRQPRGPRMHVVADDRATRSDAALQPLVEMVYFTRDLIARVALSPSRRGVSADDRRFLKLLSSELGGPLKMALLVAETKRLADTDGLTGLLNRRAFVDALELHRKKSKSDALPLSLFLLDIDHFKNINDTYGHDGGDAVLRGVAASLADVARKSDLVARWGGEEFVVALPETSIAGARVMAERVRRAIAERQHVMTDGRKLNVTASIGIASANEDNWKLDDVVGAADRAMYNAKHRGRNRVEVA